MNFKKYFLINLKQYLVLYIVSFALFSVAAFSTVMSANMTDSYTEIFEEGVWVRSFDILTNYHPIGVLYSQISPFLIFFFIMMIILPIFAMGARYSLTASDTYKQVAQKRNAIRLMNNLTLLLAVLVVFTLVYWLTIMGLGIKYANTPIQEIVPNKYYPDERTCNVRIDMHFGAYALMYPFIIIFGAAQYFISYFFVSRCNRPINSIFVLILGEIALAMLLPGVYSLINNIYYTIGSSGDETNVLVKVLTGMGNSSPILPITFLVQTFDPLLFGVKSTFDDATKAQLTIVGISLGIYLMIAAAGVIFMFFEKDPSGEYAGKPETTKPYQDIIFHIGAFSIGFYVATNLYGSLVIALVMEGIIAILYYVFLGIIRRNFKINLKNLIPYLAISVFNITLCLILFFTLDSVGIFSLF